MKKILETERLLIRELGAADWEHVFRMNTCADVMRLIGEGKIKTPDEERTGFDGILENYKKGTGLGVWAVVQKTDGAFVGAASLTPLAGTVEMQLGYRLEKKHWGRGYATEIAGGLVVYGFNYLHLDRIAATTNLDNYASMRVLEKAGFRFLETGCFYNWPMTYFAIDRTGDDHTRYVTGH